MKFALLQLFPTGNFCSGNRVVMEPNLPTKAEAIKLFQNTYPQLNLDNSGYAKIGEISYCVAESP